MSLSCPPGTFAYTIHSGDTFYSLARQFNTTVQAIILANPGVNPTALQIGQRICIPGTAPQPAVCPPNSVTYTIQSGDTLYALARRYGTTVDAILRSNPGLNPNNLRIGQQICIPRPSGACPPGTDTWTIQPGDTFFKLTQRFSTTVAELLQLNPGVNPSALRVGQQICVPRSSLRFADDVFRVSFIIPANWREVSPNRYEGPNGFFLIAAIAGPPNIEEVCRNEAFHVLRPYGSNPTIQQLTAGGQEACLILPSADQPPGMNGQAALIVRYPAPVTINGQSYNYFVLYADQAHIRGFANTLEFMPIF